MVVELASHPPTAPSPVKVRLVNAFARPHDNAVATARTCYAARIIHPEEVAHTLAARAQRDAIAASTYAAGHHTTLQHATFQFTLENVSRQFVWSFLHAHPHYNSEQASQRYVAVRPDRARVPALPAPEAALYRATLAEQMACYTELVELLTEPTAAAYFSIFPARKKHAADHARAVRKRAQEVARYALPLATFTHLYHTISGLTLHRYHRLCQVLDVPTETREVVAALVAAVAAHDPDFVSALEDPLPLAATHEHQALAALGRLEVNPGAAAFARRFDAELGAEPSRLVAATPGAEALIATAVRAVLGADAAALDDQAALALVLAARGHPYLGGALNLTSLDKLGRALGHVHYTFQKKLSHAADAQDQRHRATVGSRPVLQAHYAGGTPDVVVPHLLAQAPAALARFMASMERTWQAIDRLLNAGVAPEAALYLLPNAFPIRFYETGDLAALHHKWTTRLCYNAQEEIWRASLAEVQAVQRVHPDIGDHLGPPCALRHEAGLKPPCPEGPRYCGVPVWKLARAAYVRTL